MKTPRKTGFEESLRRLEEIVGKLEQGEVPLDESIRLYEEGIALSKACMEKLSQAELKIETLRKEMNGRLRVAEDKDPEG